MSESWRREGPTASWRHACGDRGAREADVWRHLGCSLHPGWLQPAPLGVAVAGGPTHAPTPAPLLPHGAAAVRPAPLRPTPHSCAPPLPLPPPGPRPALIAALPHRQHDLLHLCHPCAVRRARLLGPALPRLPAPAHQLARARQGGGPAAPAAPRLPSAVRRAAGALPRRRIPHLLLRGLHLHDLGSAPHVWGRVAAHC